MSEEQKNTESSSKLKVKGNIFLEIGIVVMTAILIWSIVVPMQEKELEKSLTKLSRAKMKVLFQLQFLSLYEDTAYSTDLKKLADFARRADTNIVPDSLFKPVYQVYLRFDDQRAELENMNLKDFRKKYLDSIIVNPFTGEPFLVETMVKTGRKTFSIKPSNDEAVLKRVGGVIEGEFTWDDRADMVL